ncbi:MAG: MBL fold metallo-hydrolase, partial [Verrucomicrobiota bacterium]
MAWTVHIHHIDVGQGASALIEMKSLDGLSRTVLIDGGGKDAAKPILNYCRGHGIDKVDLVISSHYDTDHINGIREILKSTSTIFRDSVIFDRGELGGIDHLGRVDGRPNEYIAYLQAVGQRLRVTQSIAPTDRSRSASP